ncbi:MAG: ABC transporter ATP-binding protein [Betaproteobacteria bacterium]
MLGLTGLRQKYGAQTVLSLDRFEAAAGEHWLVLGASGSGKTTILNLAAGLLRATEGTVEVGGQDLSKLKGGALDRWRGRSVGIVPQKLHLVSSLTVAQNLFLAQYLAGLPGDQGRAASLLKDLSLEDKSQSRPHQLSHGQAQRVAVARAVMNRPRLLLADEPTSNLDDAACAAALDLLQSQARACGATLVVATHDQRAKARFEKVLQL